MPPHPLPPVLMPVNHGLVPVIRSVYTSDIAGKMGHLRPDECWKLKAALEAVDDEEARIAHLYAAGKLLKVFGIISGANSGEDRIRTCGSFYTTTA